MLYVLTPDGVLSSHRTADAKCGAHEPCPAQRDHSQDVALARVGGVLHQTNFSYFAPNLLQTKTDALTGSRTRRNASSSVPITYRTGRTSTVASDPSRMTLRRSTTESCEPAAPKRVLGGHGVHAHP